jgi:MauM/NapG family ferredoxin protein
MVQLSRWRRISQFIFLAIFVFLFYLTQYPLDFVYTNVFLRSSPLLMITNILVTRSFSIFIPALLLVIVTLFLGRFFCGWVCPVGTISDIIPKTKRKLSSFYRFKYYYLTLLIILSIFGVNLLIISDPLVIFNRSLTFLTQVRIPVVLILIIVLVASLGERFWCRIICPLGALLGIFSLTRVLNLHVQETCTQCNLCNRVCPMDAIQECKILKTECTLCFHCIDKCPRNAITITKKKESVSVESRRTFLKAGIAAGAGVLLSPLLTRASRTPVIRPPGTLKEENFLSACVRCGECMRVCPSQGLRPVIFEGSLSALYTPKLVPRIGECQLCMLCWQVCPVNAIVEVDPSKMKIGTASVDRDTCLEWRHEQICLVCQEVCPFQAIDVIESGGQGRGRGRRGPSVNRSLCAGCGTCEKNCPVEPSSITVSPEGEIRY